MTKCKTEDVFINLVVDSSAIYNAAFDFVLKWKYLLYETVTDASIIRFSLLT